MMDTIGREAMAAKHGSLKQEQSFIMSIGGRPHKNSGRGLRKGDGTWRNFVVDVKYRGKSFTLNKDVWAKACSDAAAVDTAADPALMIVLGEPGNETKLAIIALDVLDGLTDATAD